MADRVVRDALVVAGGRGTRLQPLTFGVPKPLLPFCGEPFLAGVVRRLLEAGIKRTWLIVGADTAPFVRLEVDGMLIEVVAEPTPLDTAGGVRALADRFDNPVLVLNGDVLTDLDLGTAIDHHAAVAPDATLVLTRVADTSTFGVCVRDGSRVVDFVEKPPAGTLPGQDTVNAGAYVLEPRAMLAFDNGPLSFERHVFPGILARGGHIDSVVWDGVWTDLGTPERWLEGTRLALSGALRWPSLDRLERRPDGVLQREVVGLGTAVLSGPVGLDRVILGARARIGPNAWLGPGVQIGSDATVRDSVVMDGGHIGAGVHLERVIVGSHATIAEGARIGSNVVIGHGQSIPADADLADDTRQPQRTD